MIAQYDQIKSYYQNISNSKQPDENVVIQTLEFFSKLNPCKEDAYNMFAWIVATSTSVKTLYTGLFGLTTRYFVGKENGDNGGAFSYQKGVNVTCQMALFATCDSRPEIKIVAYKFLIIMDPKAAFYRSILIQNDEIPGFAKGGDPEKQIRKLEIDCLEMNSLPEDYNYYLKQVRLMQKTRHFIFQEREALNEILQAKSEIINEMCENKWIERLMVCATMSDARINPNLVMLSLLAILKCDFAERKKQIATIIRPRCTDAINRIALDDKLLNIKIMLEAIKNELDRLLGPSDNPNLPKRPITGGGGGDFGEDKDVKVNEEVKTKRMTA